jgi:hypothetical protein
MRLGAMTDAKGTPMNRITSSIAGAVIGLILPMQLAFAGDNRLSPLSALTGEWWQWALSIPSGQNPMLDTTGDNCMIGQKGDLWFLAGVFAADGGTVKRTCSVPENKALFFPVINSFNTNTPDCGQGGENFNVRKLTSLVKPLIDAAENLEVTVDGTPINKRQIQRVLSFPFPTAIPTDNVFGPDACGTRIPLPAGIYSPSMDDGYYVLLSPLKPGPHTLQFHATSGSFSQDITYKLTLVPVLLK